MKRRMYWFRLALAFRDKTLVEDFLTTSRSLFILASLLVVIFTSGCNVLSSGEPNSPTPLDPKRSGQKLLEYADRFVEISSLMIRLNLQKDYDTLGTKLNEAKQIATAVNLLAITSDYENAKYYLSNFMWNDCYHYSLILENGSEELIRTSSEEATNFFIQFLDEMINLGHDLN